MSDAIFHQAVNNLYQKVTQSSSHNVNTLADIEKLGVQCDIKDILNVFDDPSKAIAITFQLEKIENASFDKPCRFSMQLVLVLLHCQVLLLRLKAKLGRKLHNGSSGGPLIVLAKRLHVALRKLLCRLNILDNRQLLHRRRTKLRTNSSVHTVPCLLIAISLKYFLTQSNELTTVYKGEDQGTFCRFCFLQSKLRSNFETLLRFIHLKLLPESFKTVLKHSLPPISSTRCLQLKSCTFGHQRESQMDQKENRSLDYEPIWLKKSTVPPITTQWRKYKPIKRGREEVTTHQGAHANTLSAAFQRQRHLRFTRTAAKNPLLMSIPCSTDSTKEIPLSASQVAVLDNHGTRYRDTIPAKLLETLFNKLDAPEKVGPDAIFNDEKMDSDSFSTSEHTNFPALTLPVQFPDNNMDHVSYRAMTPPPSSQSPRSSGLGNIGLLSPTIPTTPPRAIHSANLCTPTTTPFRKVRNIHCGTPILDASPRSCSRATSCQRILALETPKRHQTRQFLHIEHDMATS